MLDEVQINYKTTKKELLTTTFLLYKFKSYLVGSKVIMYTDHIVIKYLLKKKRCKVMTTMIDTRSIGIRFGNKR